MKKTTRIPITIDYNSHNPESTIGFINTHSTQGNLLLKLMAQGNTFTIAPTILHDGIDPATEEPINPQVVEVSILLTTMKDIKAKTTEEQ